MAKFNKIGDFSDIIDPGFIDDGGVSLNGSGDIYVNSGEVVINSTGPVEIPMCDGSIGVFDSEGNLLDWK